MGQTVIVGKRPLKGHGSVIIQLGVPIIEGPLEDENQRGMSSFCHRISCYYSHIVMTSLFILNVISETRVEPVPGMLHDLFDRFFRQGIVPSKPDYCVVDFYYEVTCSRCKTSFSENAF